MRMHRLLFVVVLGLLCRGCNPSPGEIGALATPSDNAATGVAQAAGISSDLRSVATAHYFLLSSADNESAASTGRFLEQVHDRFYESFGRAGFALRPVPGKLTCVCFDSYGQMNAYARGTDGVESSWMDGYYSYRTNRIAAVRVSGQGEVRTPGPSAPSAAIYRDPSGLSGGGGLNLRTMTHELAHQLAFNSGLQNRSVTYPFWLTEGLATNFEADDSGRYGLDVNDSRNRGRLAQAKSRGALVPLGQFVGMIELSAAPSQSVQDTYAQAWGLFHYLMQSRGRELKGYMAGLSQSWAGQQDPQSLRRRFIQAFGPIEPLEKGFLQFIDESGRGGTR